jgi:hypothetical protein
MSIDTLASAAPSYHVPTGDDNQMIGFIAVMDLFRGLAQTVQQLLVANGEFRREHDQLLNRLQADNEVRSSQPKCTVHVRCFKMQVRICYKCGWVSPTRQFFSKRVCGLGRPPKTTLLRRRRKSASSRPAW